MSTAMIYNRNGWQLISYGNGLSYVLRQFRSEGAYSVGIQGDDALDFRDQFDACGDNEIDPVTYLFGDYAEVMERDI